MEYRIVRSQRKTVAIHITKDGFVEVRAPLHVSASKIEKIILEKKNWIDKHLEVAEARMIQKSNNKLTYNSQITLRGTKYPIIADDSTRAGFKGDCFHLPCNLPDEHLKLLIVKIYKKAAKNILIEKVMFYSNIMGVSPLNIKINSAKTRWGSCSGKNSINFSWRLILGSDEIIDYVVVHELAHIREHNHSHRFWDIVANTFPDYKNRQKKLKILQQQISLEGWD